MRARVVSRTLKLSTVEFEGININSKGVIKDKVMLSGAYLDSKKLYKKVEKVLNKKSIHLIKILGVSVGIYKCVMPEQNFIELAERTLIN